LEAWRKVFIGALTKLPDGTFEATGITTGGALDSAPFCGKQNGSRTAHPALW
jgi:hypothetical protein